MQLILSLASGVTVTATPVVSPAGTVGLELHADTPIGPADLTATTTKAAVRNMLAAGKAKFGPKIAAYLNRVLGMFNQPPLPVSTSPVMVDATGLRSPLTGLTGVGEGAASAGLWAYGPYAVTVPVTYRVRRRWDLQNRRTPWWWPRNWAWRGPLLPAPPGYGLPQWMLPWQLRTDAAGPQRPFAASNPGAGNAPSPGGASIGRGRGGGGGPGPNFWDRASFGAGDFSLMVAPQTLAAGSVGPVGRAPLVTATPVGTPAGFTPPSGTMPIATGRPAANGLVPSGCGETMTGRNLPTFRKLFAGKFDPHYAFLGGGTSGAMITVPFEFVRCG